MFCVLENTVPVTRSSGACKAFGTVRSNIMRQGFKPSR
jgi:hypothetical protein